MTVIPQSFSEAEEQFRRFLLQQGNEGRIVWVFPADVTSRGAWMWVRWPLPDDNRPRVAALYEAAKTGSGIRLDARCRVPGCICATLSLPKADDGLTGRFISGLVLAASDPLETAELIGSRWAWRLLVWRNGTPPGTGRARSIHEDS